MLATDSPNLYYSQQKDWGFLEPTFFDMKNKLIWESDKEYMLWRYIDVEEFLQINQ